MDLGGAAAGGVPCGTLSFFGLPAAGCVLCGPFLSLGFLLAVLLEDNFCGSGRCCCWWCSVWDTFFGLPAAGGVPRGLSLSLGFLLLAVFRVGLPLSLGYLLLAVFCVDPFSLWASCWLFSWRTTSVDLGGAAAGGVPCGTLSLGFLLLVVFLVDSLSLFGLPAAGCVPCGPPSLFGLPAAGCVPCGPPSLSGLPAGCSLRGQLLWLWALLLLAVVRHCKTDSIRL